MENYRKPHQIVIGSSISLISYFAVSLMGVLVKVASPTLDMGMIIFCQYFVSLLCSLFFLPKYGIKTLKTTRFAGHLFRDLVGIATFGLFFLSVAHISLTNATVLRSTTPFWIPLILLLWRKESIPPSLWISILIGFLGVAFVVKPSTSGYLSLGTIYALGSGLFMALAALSIRRLSKTEPAHRTLFYYCLIGTLVSLPFFKWKLLELWHLSILLGIGILMFIVQWTLIIAFQYAKASRLAPMSYTAVLFSVIWDLTLWHKVPDVISSLGIAIIIGSGLAAIWLEKKKE